MARDPGVQHLMLPSLSADRRIGSLSLGFITIFGLLSASGAPVAVTSLISPGLVAV